MQRIIQDLLKPYRGDAKLMIMSYIFLFMISYLMISYLTIN